MSHNVGNKNGLQVICDWLSFTITNDTDVNKVMSLFGLDIESFKELDHGLMGYTKMLIYESTCMKVLYNGRCDMGVNIIVNSKSLSYFIDVYKETKGSPAASFDEDTYAFIEILKLIRNNGHVTRIDFAIDDIETNYFSIDEISKRYDEYRIKSKFRKHKTIKEDENHVTTGNTIYFGSRQSEIMLRIYDKALEQKNKLENLPESWVRWELEIHADKANQVIDKIINGENIVELVFKLLNTYFCIIDLTDSNRSRCAVNEKWKKFIGSVSKVKFKIPDREESIEKKMDYLEVQASRSLAMVLMAKGGDEDYLGKLLQIGAEKLSKRNYETIDNYLLEHREGFIS